MKKVRLGLLLIVILAAAAGFIAAPAEAGTIRWQGKDGNWEDASQWGGTLPTSKSFAFIDGKTHVHLKSARAAVARLELGTQRNADGTLTMIGGSLAALEFIRLGEAAGSHGKFVLHGGQVCATQLAIGGMNVGTSDGLPCRAEMEVHGGSLLMQYLTLGYRLGSTARLRVVGSKATCIVALNSINCSIPTSGVGSTCELAFDIDAAGVTPIVLWNKQESIRLSRKDRPNKCLLRVGLLDTPPVGDITLMHSTRTCLGIFNDLSEGSRVRAEHADKTYEWRLTYRGGSAKCDITLCDPHLVTAEGKRLAHTIGKPARRLKIEAAEIQAAWQELYRHADLTAPPLGSGTLAFPGAEGYGAYARGGRGGKALFVTNLNDSGPGSLRAAIDTPGPRTVIFRVGGLIELKKPLQIREPFLTIAGQTAPGDGICLKGAGGNDALVLNNTHDIIIRHLRVRPGHTGDNGDGDCISCYSSENFILDHCSASWGSDETISCTQTCDRYTVQWCILAEGLNYDNHSMGSILGGDRSTWHHNLYAHCRTRNPRFAGLCRCDFRNNLLYDWGDTCGYGDFRTVNYVNNYARPGPSTTEKPPRFIRGDSFAMPGALFLDGNLLDGFADVSRDNRLGTGFALEVFAKMPHAAPPVQTQSAADAYDLVLQQAGALVPRRDAIDTRIVTQVRQRTGKIIRHEKDVGGWPAYAGGDALLDSDNDGIPDAWERARGLDPNDPSDANRVTADGYTHLEHYLNSLVQTKVR